MRTASPKLLEVGPPGMAVTTLENCARSDRTTRMERECDGGTKHWSFGHQSRELLRRRDFYPHSLEPAGSADLRRDPERCAEHPRHARRIVERDQGPRSQ